jgi:hypothetical protein
MGIQGDHRGGNGNTGETERQGWEYRGGIEEMMGIQGEQRGGDEYSGGTERRV